MGICQSREASGLDMKSTKQVLKGPVNPSCSDDSTQKRGDESPIEQGEAPSFRYQTGTCALEYWDPIKKLGEGSISSIHLVKRRKDRMNVPYKERVDIMTLSSIARTEDDDDDDEQKVKIFALKSIVKDHIRNERFLDEMRNEIHTMSQLNHPNVAKVYEAFERKRHIYLIMEYCSGGDLASGDWQFTENQAAAIIFKILSAVTYLHKHKVIHRDLKLENIMFDEKPCSDVDTEVKIIDFGLATRYLSDDCKRMTDKVGTLYSMAPQVLQGVYDSKCDLWSIGVISYILLSGGLQPFYGPPRDMPWEQRRRVMVDRIMRGAYTRMTGPRWANISPEAKAFVKSLLRVDPVIRPSAFLALNSRWMRKYENSNNKSADLYATQSPLDQEIALLQQTARVLIANKLTNDDIMELKRRCEEHDAANMGKINLNNFVTVLTATKLTSDEVSAIARCFAEKEGERSLVAISYLDLVVRILQSKHRNQSERMIDTFSRLDVEKTKRVPKDEILGELRKSTTAEQLCDQVLVGVRGDQEGSVSLQDVLAEMSAHNTNRLQEVMMCGHNGVVLEDQLVGVNDAVIPGGKNDPSGRPPEFMYDMATKSLHKSIRVLPNHKQLSNQ